MTAAHPGLPFPRRFYAVVAITVGSLLLMIDASIAGVVLPTLAQELKIDSAQSVLVATAYQLVLAMALLPMAALGDRIGQRRLYCGGLVLHSLASLLFLLAESLPAIITVRCIQAVGTAASMSVAFGLIRLVYPPEHLGKGLAINTIANAGGTALAPVAGGFIIAVFDWHWAFMAVIPFSMVALMFGRFLPDPPPEEKSFDIRGAVLCATSFGLVVVGLETTIRGPDLWMGLAVLAIACVSVWYFVRYEVRHPHPVLPVDLLGQTPVALAIFSNLCAVLASMILLLYVPFRLQHDFGFSPGEIGGMLASYAVASVMIAPLSGALSDRVSVPLLCSLGMVVSMIGLVALFFLAEQSSRWDITWRLWLCGAGFGMFFAPNARMIIGSVPIERSASAGSMVSTTRMLAQALGASMVAAMFALGLGGGSVPFLVAAGLVMIVAVISVLRLMGIGVSR